MKVKEIVHTVAAIALIVSAIVLSFLSFFLSAEHCIHESVLWYFAQTLLYSGSLFGIADYTKFCITKYSSKK